MLNPCELEIDLFCKGMRIDPSCMLEREGRWLARTRAGLGSGLELVIPGDSKDIWVNVPVEEDFVLDSPYLLVREDSGYYICDKRNGCRYRVEVPPEPGWYMRRTSRGTPMHKVGVLQGTYLGIYIGPTCAFWTQGEPLNCKFCTTGLNVGVNEEAHKHLEDVVETCLAAKEESGVTFVHFNSGFQGGREVESALPYVRAVKERVGMLVGFQATPVADLAQYDRLIDAGCDHFSFCFEFYNPRYFAELLPGKARFLGQAVFFRAMEYTAKRLGKGRVSGEIIAGIEPIEDTLRAIDYIASLGAFPTVCIFRPTIGSDLEHLPPPRFEDMLVVFKHMYEACMKNAIPIGIAPNIEVSLVVLPTDAVYLAGRSWRHYIYRFRSKLLKGVMRPCFYFKMRPLGSGTRRKFGANAQAFEINGQGGEAKLGDK